VVGEDDLVVLAQRQLLLGLAPVLVERGGVVDRGLLAADGADGGVLHAVAGEGHALLAALARRADAALDHVILDQVGRVGRIHVLVVAPAIQGDVAGAGVLVEVVADHAVAVAALPARAADVVVVAAHPVDPEVALLVQLERGFAAILPVGKEQVAHMAGGMALGEQGLALEALGVGLELADRRLGLPGGGLGLRYIIGRRRGAAGQGQDQGGSQEGLGEV
jgi:hypothetical protein